MEFVEGQTLRELVKIRKGLDLALWSRHGSTAYRCSGLCSR